MGIRLSYDRYEEIKRIAVNMLVQHGITCFPINAFDIAAKMGIAVIPYSAFSPDKRQLLLKESNDGFSIKLSTGEWLIYYNDSIENYGRVNNTIMHEIGHIVLDHTEDSELAETEVRFFAKYALVPPPIVRQLGIVSYTQIIKAFNVSIEAAKNAMDYYSKWMVYCGTQYCDYEITLLNQFYTVADRNGMKEGDYIDCDRETH